MEQSDIQAAALFGELFEHLADGEPLTPKKIWEMIREGRYDFSFYQMGCDEALVDLGLLWYCSNEHENYGPAEETPACEECGAIREQKRCGKMGCEATAVEPQVVGGLAYNACRNHREEIESLVKGE